MISFNEPTFPCDTHQLIDRLCRCPRRAAGVDDVDLVEAVALILDQRHEALDIDVVADTLAVSRRTLERRFRNRMGISVRRAIVLVRLEVARYLLVQTDLNITAVSVEAGFSSPSRMSNVFRRELGCSPRDFRRTSFTATGSPRSVSPAVDRRLEANQPAPDQGSPAADAAGVNKDDPARPYPDALFQAVVIEVVRPGVPPSLASVETVDEWPMEFVAMDEVFTEIVAADENFDALDQPSPSRVLQNISRQRFNRTSA